ncbi:MAG: universal stress protein [Chloroflexia bacterium]
MFSKILVLLDGSESAERALPYAEAIGLRLNSTLILVRAATTHLLRATYPTEPAQEVMREAKEYVDGIARGLAERGVTVETAVPYAEPVEGVLSELRRWEADLIVMSTHGRSGLGRWVYGGVAEHVLAHSPAPVLLVRAWRAKPCRSHLVSSRVVAPLDAPRSPRRRCPQRRVLPRRSAASSCC